MKKLLCFLSFAAILVSLVLWQRSLDPQKDVWEERDIRSTHSDDSSTSVAHEDFAGRQPAPQQTAGHSDSRILSLAGLEGPTTDESHSHSLGRWKARMAPSPLEWGEDTRRLNFALKTPDGEDLHLRFDRAQMPGENQVIYSGKVEGSSFSQVIVSCYEDAVSGVIRLPSEGVSWELRNERGGFVEFEKVDLEKLRDCSLCGVRDR